MRPIPQSLKRKLSNDPFMKKCVWCGVESGIEWNHALIYQNRQVNESYAIVPLCIKCHRGELGTIKKTIKDYCTFIAISRGLSDLVVKYPRHDWKQEKDYLTSKFIKV
jgi:hypothetical protein